MNLPNQASRVTVRNWPKLGIGRERKVCEVNCCTVSRMHYLTGVTVFKIELIHYLTPNQNFLLFSPKGQRRPTDSCTWAGPILTIFPHSSSVNRSFVLTMWTGMIYVLRLKIDLVSIYMRSYSEYTLGDYFKGSITPHVLLEAKADTGARLAASNVKLDLSSGLTFGQYLFDKYFDHLKRASLTDY